MRVPLINGAGLLGALGLAIALTMSNAPGDAHAPAEAGAETVTDASGVVHPVDSYARIASASTVADQVLARIASRERIVAVAAHTQRADHEPWRYAGKPGIEQLEDLEALLALRPDLVFANNLADRQRIARLRERGLRVFDLGRMEGRATLVPSIVAIATLIGHRERGEAIAARFERRLDRVAAGVGERPRAAYVSELGDQLYGGARGTSYHDVLVAAGLRDAAAEADYEGWPVFAAEELLEMAPEWVVTPAGGEAALCAHVGMEALEACRQGRVVGIAPKLIGDPGFGMLPAAEALFDAVHRQSE